MMQKLNLSLAIGPYDHVRDVLDGTIPVEGVETQHRGYASHHFPSTTMIPRPSMKVTNTASNSSPSPSPITSASYRRTRRRPQMKPSHGRPVEGVPKLAIAPCRVKEIAITV